MKSLKFILSFIIGFILINLNLNAQNLSKDAKISFLGIDYSHVKLVGEMAHWGSNSMSTDEIVDKYFPAWNSLFVNEAKKYDLNKNFKTKNITTTVSFFDKINEKTNAAKLVTDASPMVSDVDVQTWVKKYDYKSVETPYAIFLVAIELNKGKEIASYYWVLYDKSNHQFYVSDLQIGKPGGFGFRNYWASSFYRVLEKANKSTSKWFAK